MLFDDTYKTIDSPVESSFRDRGSKFLGYAMPVRSEEEIKAHLQTLKKQHPDATHHCYAWRLKPDKSAYRANDDGEPAGSAGKPILGQIQSLDLTNVLVVVVRYFGGSLLGIPGLIHSYKTTASEALTKAVISTRTVNDIYKVSFDYTYLNEVMKVMKDEGLKMITQEFDNRCEIIFSVRKSLLNNVLNRLDMQGTQLTWLETA